MTSSAESIDHVSLNVPTGGLRVSRYALMELLINDGGVNAYEKRYELCGRSMNNN